MATPTKKQRLAELLEHLNTKQGPGWAPAKNAPGAHIWVQKGSMLLLHSFGRTPEEDSYSIFMSIPCTTDSIVAHGLTALEAVDRGLVRARELRDAVSRAIGAVTGESPRKHSRLGMRAIRGGKS